MSVEISPEGLFPFVSRKGGELERFAKSVHVGRKSGLGQTAGDPIDMVCLNVGTRPPCNLMTVARFWRFAAEIGLIKLRPERCVLDEVVDPVDMFGELGVVCELVVGVVQRDRYGERDELRSERIEW